MAVNLNKLRTRLEDEKKRLLAELNEMEGSGQPDEIRREGSPFGKREEEATESFELEKRLALEKQIKQHIDELDHALEKIKKGTHGLCDICGQAIGAERLEAIPEAHLCVSCKAKVDAKSKFAA